MPTSPLAVSSPAGFRMAIFIDIENVCGYCDHLGTPIDITPVLTRLATIASPIIRRSFGDICALPPRFSQQKVRRMLQRNGVNHEDVLHLSHGKNSADIRLAVAAIALAHQRPDITHFAVMSNDRDFLPLFHYLREMGRVVIGIGPSKARVNDDYRQACDAFLFHEDLAPALQSPSNPNPQNKPVQQTKMPQSGLAHLEAAMLSLQAKGMICSGAHLGNTLRTMFPDVDFGQGPGSLKRFCSEMAKSGRIVFVETDTSDFAIEFVHSRLAIPATLTPAPAPVVAPSLQARYKSWCQHVLHMDIPSLRSREQFFAALTLLLANQSNHSPMTIKEMAVKVLATIENPADMTPAGYPLLYSLCVCRALQYGLTSEPGNPECLSLAVASDRIEHHFVVYVLALFRQRHGDLPFDAKVWATLLYGDSSLGWKIEMIEAVHKMLT